MLLQVEGLTRAFGGLVAVDDLSFTVTEGEILGLLGPNGSGKTTAFNLIAGALPADAGRVVFSGRDLTRAPAHVRARAGIARTFQLIRPLPHLSALDNVLVARLYGRAAPRAVGPTRDECLQYLDLVGLAANAATPAANLTLAERKRLELARALAADPRVLLLDEPLSGLAASEVGVTLSLFRQIRAGGVTLVIVEHNVLAVRTICDRVIVLNYGRQVAEGRPDEVLARPEVIQIYLGTGTSVRWTVS
jgi:ABC-type branched-subunit amino acid transport system ATPase component